MSNYILNVTCITHNIIVLKNLQLIVHSFNIFVASPSFYPIKKAHIPNYGLIANIHLLPFLIKQENFGFDLYASVKAGRYYIFNGEQYIPLKGGFEYGVYGGASLQC